MKHLLSIKDLKRAEISTIILHALKIKRNPQRYSKSLYQKTLLMMFQAPSLRTRLSFEVAMTQMGGNAINYDLSMSPWERGKETIEDSAKVISRYCDFIMARIYNHKDLEKLALNSSIPVINGLTNFEHPCQILGDFLTIVEKRAKLSGLKLAYLGDGNNNVTHSLLYGCSISGMDISISCPKSKNFSPLSKVVQESKKFAESSGSKVIITNQPRLAVKDADILYTDSWMSYRINPKEKNKRIKILKSYQVNKKLMNSAKPGTLFMHCLPALREQEVTSDVIDSKNSVVFDQAENRLHIQKSILLYLL